MIVAYFISAAIGVGMFFIASKLSLPMRLGLSIGTFLVLMLAVTIIINRVGDRAPPDAVTIDPKQLQDGGNSKE
ncbi:MAG: hypothetical protein AB7T07_01445 [Steroidobacteraceae bacterium]